MLDSSLSFSPELQFCSFALPNETISNVTVVQASVSNAAEPTV